MALSEPTGLTLTDPYPSTANATLTWDAVPGAATYTVGFTAAGLTDPVPAYPGLTETTFLLQTFPYEQDYGFYVKAVSADGEESPWSEELAVNLPLPDGSGGGSPDPINYGSPLGMLRLRIADTATPYVLTDEALLGLLASHGITADAATASFEDGQRGPMLYAAADALLTIAVNEVLVGKYLRAADGTTTDGTKVGQELRAQADRLRAEATIADEEDADAAGFTTFVTEFAPARSVIW